MPTFTLLISFALYCICLANDGYYIDGPDPRAWAPAWGLLIFGWMGVTAGTFTWLANPALFFAWISMLRSKYRAALLAAIIALSLMISFLLQSTVVSSEAPTYSRIIGYGTGFWLWVGSAVIQIVGCIVMLAFRSRQKVGMN